MGVLEKYGWDIEEKESEAYDKSMESFISNNNSRSFDIKKTSTAATQGAAVSAPQMAVVIETVKKSKEVFVTNLQCAHDGEKNNTVSDKENKTGAISLLAIFIGVIIIIFVAVLPAAMITIAVPYAIAAVIPEENTIIEVAERELEQYEDNIGGQKYKDWYGMDGNWCAMFVSYCSNECGYIEEGIMPKSASVLVMSVWYKQNDQWIDATGYEPQMGDIIFFQNNASHVGIVVDYDEVRKVIYTIEGNTGSSNTDPYHKGSRVKKCSYPITYLKISGYGIPKYPYLENE